MIKCSKRKTIKDCVKACLYKWTLKRNLEEFLHFQPLLGQNQVALSTKDRHL